MIRAGDMPAAASRPKARVYDCPVLRCPRGRRHGELMCRDCWPLVPAPLRRAVRAAWDALASAPDPAARARALDAWRGTRDDAVRQAGQRLRRLEREGGSGGMKYMCTRGHLHRSQDAAANCRRCRAQGLCSLPATGKTVVDDKSKRGAPRAPMTRADEERAIARFVERHGVTRCPPALALGLTAIEAATGVTLAERDSEWALRLRRRSRDAGTCARQNARRRRPRGERALKGGKE